MECRELFREIGVPGADDRFVGSYCIYPGTYYDRDNPPGTEICLASEMNCGDPRPY
jgi:hypothetical protein